MKNSKLFLTSLLAAAAMSVPAYADTVTYTGGSSVTDQTLGSYTLSDTITMGTSIAEDSPDENLGSMVAGDNFYPPAYTLSFWVDISALPSSGNITLFTYGGSVPDGDNGSNALVLNSNGTLTFGQGKTAGTSFTFTSDRQQTTTTTLSTGTVYHIALVNNGQGGSSNTATLYINGTAVLNNVTVNLNMGNGNENTVFSNLNLASASNISYGEAMLFSNIALSQQGIQRYATHNSSNLIWNGSASNNWNSSDANWTKDSTEGFTFEETDNVTFVSDATVTVSENVTANRVSITGGTVSFSATESSTVSVMDGVFVTGGTLNLSTNVFAAGTEFNVSGGELALGSAFALTKGTSIDVSDAGTITGTITSMGAGSSLTLAGTGANAVTITSMGVGSSLTLAGTGASTVTLNGAIGANAVVNVSGNSAVTGTITDLGNGAQLTLNGTNASTLTWRHDGANKTTNASIFIGSESTFKDVSIYKYHLELSGTLSGAGTLIAAVASNDANQNDGWRYITLSGSTAGFTGEWQLESANGTNSSYPNDNRHVLGILNSSDGVFGGVVNFTSTGADAAKVSSKLVLLKDMEIGGLKGSELTNTSVVGASSVSDDTSGAITTADRALTINVADGKSYDYAGKIDSTVSLKKTGSGTQILSGDNSSYTGTTTLEAGTLGVGHANALGTSALNVTGNATLQMDALAVSTFANDVSVADGKTLSVQAYATDFTGAISGNGNMTVQTLTYSGSDVLSLSGDNTALAGTLSVEGLASVNAKHVNALGSGMLKIKTTEVYGTTNVGTVNAGIAGVKLNDVSISLKNAATAVLTADTDCSFTVAEGATLYLDIGALTEATLRPGEDVSLTIAAASAFDNSFFSAVKVGTYVDDVWQISSEWKYSADTWNVSAGTLTITAIPEPSVFGLLAGLGALALAGSRRRRRKA